MQANLSRRHRLLGWWYLCIGTGFVLLGFSRLLKGELLWLIGLRCALATGFFALAYFEFRSARK
jgi:hypothetical protein